MSNVISFVGTIGKDAEVRQANSGASVLTVTVANNVGFGDRQKTNWMRVTVFGKRAEGRLVDFLKKGQQVFVSGELTVSEYTNKDNETKYSLEVNASTLDPVGKRGEPSQDRQAAQPKPQYTQEQFEADIPF